MNLRSKNRRDVVKANPSKARIREMIAEATVDANGDEEQRMGFEAMLDENLALPFEVTVLGVKAAVVQVRPNDGGELVAVCRSGAATVRVSLLDLRRPKPEPRGWEWVEAYREWARARA